MTIQCRPRSILVVASVLLVATFALAATIFAKPPGGDGNASFPHDDVSWSPDARFVVKNVETPQDSRSPHSIFLTDMKTGQRALLYSYARRADVLWSPASNALAINDWDANDDAECIVFMLTPQEGRMDLREDFEKSRRPDQEKELATDRRDYNHNYAHVVRWLNANTLLLVIEGRSSDRKRSFLLMYDYQLGNSFRLRKRIIR